ncbi:MAG: hypothetical protein STHCBS139747_002332 [Sporothrix thermara]
MAGGQGPGANSRGRGGKFRKFTRGGGKHFSRDLRPLDADGNEISMWGENDQKKDSDDDSSEEDSSEESEEEDDSDGNGKGVAAVAAASREDRKKEKKARKEAAIARAKGQAVQVGDLPSSDDESEDEALPANPNHSRAARSQTKAPAAKVDVDSAANAVKEMSISSSAAPQSRRERESMEAQLAKERYRKLHEQGKTDEAKADLARLKIIREKRAAEAARKQAEKEEREALEKARKQEIEAREAKLREAALGKPKKGKK